jgi:hypothetical protein
MVEFVCRKTEGNNPEQSRLESKAIDTIKEQSSNPMHGSWDASLLE